MINPHGVVSQNTHVQHFGDREVLPYHPCTTLMATKTFAILAKDNINSDNVLKHHAMPTLNVNNTAFKMATITKFMHTNKRTMSHLMLLASQVRTCR